MSGSNPPKSSRDGAAPIPLVVDDVSALVGATPLVRIRRLGRGAGQPPRAEIWAKMEQSNPTGSVKDRIALAMITDAERRGLLAKGGVVVEPTSGNTGIGLALVCAVRGYRLVLTMPESMSLERRQLLEAFGATLVLTRAEDQMAGAIAEAHAIVRKTPGAYMPSQFDNPANPEAHATTTALEILSALDGDPVQAFVAGVGTGGTVTGVGRAWKADAVRRGATAPRIVAVEPASAPLLSEGRTGPSKIQGLAAGFVPHNVDRSVVDEVRVVDDRLAWDTKDALARNEGLLVGISSGAAVAIALEVARERPDAGAVVTVLCDTGERYFSLESHFGATVPSDDPAAETGDAP
ncbi:MAG: cysteine synthase A [Polyangiaceae bacterium]